jgi:hydrogenase nickel incorporation protein HypA/HybF
VHEASVTEALVRIAREEAKKLGAKRVLAVDLTVGEATGYMKESLEFFFRVISKGTELEGAVLNVLMVKPKLKCPSCGLIFERAGFSFDCPTCGSRASLADFGDEFRIDAIEIETEAP